MQNVSKLYTHKDILVACDLGLVRIEWRADLFPVVWRIFFPTIPVGRFSPLPTAIFFSGATEEGENDDQNSAHRPGSKEGQWKDDIFFQYIFNIFERFLVYKYFFKIKQHSIVCLPSRLRKEI